MLSRTADTLFWLGPLRRARRQHRAHHRCREPPRRHADRLCRRRPTNGNRRSPPPVRSTPSRRIHGEPPTATRSSTSSPSRRTTRRASAPASTPRAHNARAVRTALTAEMWEAINGAWLELKRFDGTKMDRPTRSTTFLTCVKEACLRFDGSAYRDDAAQRRLFLPPPRRLSRARRQHRPHPRREVSRAAARRGAASAAASTTSSGPRSCARSRRSPPIAGSITRA